MVTIFDGPSVLTIHNLLSTLEHHFSSALDQGEFSLFLRFINIIGLVILFSIPSFKYAFF